LTTTFKALSGRTIPHLFDLRSLAPAALSRAASRARREAIDLRGLSAGAQLAVFRVIKERGRYPEETLDGVMTNWLKKLGQRRHHLR